MKNKVIATFILLGGAMLYDQAQAQSCIVPDTPPVCQHIPGQWLVGPTYVNCGDKLFVIGVWEPAATIYLPAVTLGCSGSNGEKSGPYQYNSLKHYSVVDCQQVVTTDPQGDATPCWGTIPDGTSCVDTCGG